MKKKRKIDFVIYEDEDEKIVFRFYPRQSRCHSFNEELPKSWKEVYKVYYFYSIFTVDKEDGSHEVLFDGRCDECSVIDEVAARIKLIIDGKTTHAVHDSTLNKDYVIQLLNEDIYSFADCVVWRIELCKEKYEIYLWDWQGKGYRFGLSKEKLKAFGEYLEYCCEYMLEHGESI